MGDFHAFCSADRDYLLREAGAFYERRFSRPADAVRYICAWLGFQILLADWLPVGQRGEVCFTEHRIYINPAAYAGENARKNRSLRRVTETITHELAHIRLHEAQLRAGIVTDEQEEEAQQYARIFLLPRRAYQDAAPTVAGFSTVCAYRAARDYDVTPGTAIVRAREICPLPKIGVVPQLELSTEEIPLDRLMKG